MRSFTSSCGLSLGLGCLLFLVLVGFGQVAALAKSNGVVREVFVLALSHLLGLALVRKVLWLRQDVPGEVPRITFVAHTAVKRTVAFLAVALAHRVLVV